MYEKIIEKYGENVTDLAGIIHDCIIDGLQPDLNDLERWKESNVLNVTLEMLKETLIFYSKDE